MTDLLKTIPFLFLFWSPFFLLQEPAKDAAPVEESMVSESYCAHDWIQNTKLEQDPTLRLQQEIFEQQWQAFKKQSSNLTETPPADYTLPVVIHIIHNNGPGNISDALVLQGFQDLNNAFANLDYYDPTTGVDTKIEFCLAKRDPDGNATTGITRTVSTLANLTIETEDVQMKDLSRWDPLQYINVWVVNGICSASVGCGVAGYAYFPTSHGAPEDGIVMEASWLGTDPASSSVLAHEMGHYLGLYHTFQGGCGNDDCLQDGDRVCDTPPDQSTAPVPCNSSMNSCMTDVNTADPNNPFTTDQNDMFINYMDYGDWNCYSAFTEGQRERMTFSIENIRASLLDSEACQSPCTSNLTASFTTPSLIVDLQGNITFTNTSLDATNYSWLIDGVEFSTDVNPSYTFNSEGDFEITLVSRNADPNCVERITVTIQVVCPVQANYSVNLTPPFVVGQNIVYSNTSVNATNHTWLLDNIVVSTAGQYPTSFSTPGIYEVCYIATSAICADTICQQYNILTDIDCGSGLDDDGDGLVGCYDPDCCSDEACVNNYYNECPIDCEFDPTEAEFELELEWASSGQGNWCNYNTPIVGDLDGDGIPEVIGKPCTGTGQSSTAALPNLLIVNGETGVVEDVIETPGLKYLWDGPSIADVDQDGYPEIFFQASNHISNQNYQSGGPIISGDVRRKILCYSYNGSTYVEKWMSDAPAGYSIIEEANTVSITDFNQDGIAELYVQNMIFNALDGTLLVAGGAQAHRGMKFFGESLIQASSYTVAVDVFPDNACANCAGLELIAGGTVYSVNIDNINSTIIAERVLPGSSDGWTSIADVDQDGDLDAVIATNVSNTTEAIVFVWDLQTETELYPAISLPTSWAYIALANVADFDGEEGVEIGVCTRYIYQVLKPVNGVLTVLWRIDTNDFSGQTGTTVFDFNNDGANEVVYRQETEIQILNGADGTILATAPCTSGTRVEYPIVVDVDADGETEILCSCTNQLKSFGSGGTPWVSTRQVWNQHVYFNVNINDDLTIPIQQQSHHIVGDSIVLNNFLTQYGDNRFPAYDVSVEFVEVSCGDIDDDPEGLYVNITYEFCNQGSRAIIDDVEFTRYNGDPTQGSVSSTTLNASSWWANDLQPGECVRVTEQLPRNTYFGVINDDGDATLPLDFETVFPITPFPECDYSNNFDSFILNDEDYPLDLGADVQICDNGVASFEATPGFDRYEWQDGAAGASYTAYEAGTYIVTAIAGCVLKKDTIEVTITPSTIIDLGPDQLNCQGDSISFSATGFDHYRWYPNANLSCDTCSTIWVTPNQPTTYILIANTDEGCYSTDSIVVFVPSNSFENLEFTVCQGASYTFDDVEIPAGESETFIYDSFYGCDSIIQVNIIPNQFSATTELISLTACQGDSAIYENILLPADSSLTLIYQTINDCDSIIIVNVQSLDTFFTTEEILICAGDSALVLGNYENTSGIYQTTYNSFADCDSIHQVTLEVLEPLTANLLILPSCLDDNTGSVTAMVNGGMSPYDFVWSDSGGIDNEISSLTEGNYELTITDGNQCVEIINFDVGSIQALSIDATIEDVTCYGESDGQVSIDSLYAGLEFSLDNIGFQSDLVFENLPAGDYELYILDDQGCISSQDFFIEEPQELLLEVSKDTSIVLGCPVELRSFTNSTDSIIYQWSPLTDLVCADCPRTIAQPFFTTNYELLIMDESGCEAIDEVLISVDKPRNVYIPNVFSPNGDGINDAFLVYTSKEVDLIVTLKVFDRWGELVFEGNDFPPNDIREGWTGNFKEESMNPGVFVYVAVVRFLDGTEIQYQGDVTLLR